MKSQKLFANAAARLSQELVAQLPKDVQEAVAQAVQNGFRLSMAMVVDGAGQSSIVLSVVDDYGRHQVLLTHTPDRPEVH